MALSDTKLRSISGKPYNGPAEIADRDGLSVRISPKGLITFQRRYRWQNKPARIRFGNYPELSLSDARELNEEAKRSAAKGIDPRFENKMGTKLNLGPVTVKMALDYFLTEYVDKNLKSAGKVKKLFANHVYPFMGDVPLELTETRHWIAMFKKVSENAPVQAGILLSKLKQALRFCRVHRYADCTALDDLRVTDIGKKEEIGERRLVDAELKKLWPYLHETRLIGDRNRLVTILVLLYGCRTVELRTSLKSDWDLKNRVWKATDTKAGHTVRRPIPDPFVPYIQRLMDFYPESQYLVPVEDSYKTGVDKPVSGQSLVSITSRISKHLGLDDWGLHDLRRTLDTSLSELGIPPYIIEKMLGHKLAGVMAVYNKHDYLKDQEHAYITWYNHLVTNAADSNVVAFKKHTAR
ncbi:tyrosine-type recombinase/integrase [Alishewanella sp. d11]|uniref:tyrosine-type recombinase/integrase n=1 Tax=Alishewanella sp. d11 TaxID=3414030 RepID=UPI003BF8699A